jgi:urease accessory protein
MHTALRRLLLLLTLATRLALAHPSSDHALSFASGIAHPFSGVDHLLAMVAVGMLGARLKNRALWILPLTFMSMLAVGALIGIGESPSPIVEIGIAVSIVAFGALLAVKRHLNRVVAATVVGTFALAHGYAHAAESVAESGLSYLSGILIASLVLHVAGIGAACLLMRRRDELPLRVAGTALAIIGSGLLLG